MEILFFALSIGFAAYGYFKNNSSFIHVGVMFLVLAAWPIVTFFIPNIFPSAFGQRIFQFLLFMIVISFIRSKMR